MNLLPPRTGFAALLLAAATTLPLLASAATLVRDGQPKAVIVIPPEPDEFETRALNELTTNIEKMSGAKLPSTTLNAKQAAALVAEAKGKGQVPILIGRAATEAPNVPDRGAFVLQVGKDSVTIAGNGEGPAFGVAELLEQLGCRWFMPGDLGTVIPQLKTITVAEQTIQQRPSFPSRWFQMPDKDWQVRVRCGGDPFSGGHGIHAPPFKLDKATNTWVPKENAEYYGLVKGVRVGRQHCVSNPKLIEFTVNRIKELRKSGKGPVIALGPNDGAGFCECENCRALDGGDFDPFSNEVSVTDRYVWFFNQVLKGLDAEYPDTKLAFYIYHSYMRPPKRWKLDPRITGALAPISLDRVHGFSNPIAPEKSYAKWLFQEWGKIMPELYDRGYWSNLSDPGFPFVIVHRLRDEIPACYDLGLKGWRVETFPNYGPMFPSNYVAAKLMWNHQTDVDALLKDCYEKFFGPAAGPMGKYLTMMDAALRDGDFSTGSAWDMPHFYPAKLRKDARGLLDEGKKLAAGKGDYAARVQMITETFDMLEAFIAMMDARTRVDFPAAKAEMDKLDAVAGKLMEYKPIPMVSAGRFSTYVNYMKRFFRPCTEQGYERVTGENKLIATTKDEWEFQIDPQNVGEEIGLWRSDYRGGNWQTIKTSSSSWSNQGLRYYKGLAWYRQTVEVPESTPRERVFLWCGGVDELAKVWVNGQPIGISHGSAISPFELDATPAVKPGRNVTGGILAPVILYAPAGGKDAQLRNTRDLKPTFP
jgi:hypothetical protein